MHSFCFLRKSILTASIIFLFPLITEAKPTPTNSAILVSTEKVKAVLDAKEIVVPGTVRAQESTILKAEAEGRIISINVRSGQNVIANQPLVQINPGGLTGQLKSAQATYNLKLITFKRNQSLFASKGLSAEDRDTVSDLVQCLDLGADDYLTKPFDIDELHARIRALHRRSVHRPENILVHGDLVVDPASHTVTLAGQEISIPRREFSLLQKLLENVGHVLSRDQLTQSLYSWEDEIDSNALEVHIHNLRKKLGNNLIRTIRGVGYLIAKVGQND